MNSCRCRGIRGTRRLAGRRRGRKGPDAHAAHAAAGPGDVLFAVLLGQAVFVGSEPASIAGGLDRLAQVDAAAGDVMAAGAAVLGVRRRRTFSSISFLIRVSSQLPSRAVAQMSACSLQAASTWAMRW